MKYFNETTSQKSKRNRNENISSNNTAQGDSREFGRHADFKVGGDGIDGSVKQPIFLATPHPTEAAQHTKRAPRRNIDAFLENNASKIVYADPGADRNAPRKVLGLLQQPQAPPTMVREDDHQSSAGSLLQRRLSHHHSPRDGQAPRSLVRGSNRSNALAPNGADLFGQSTDEVGSSGTWA